MKSKLTEIKGARNALDQRTVRRLLDIWTYSTELTTAAAAAAAVKLIEWGSINKNWKRSF